MKSVYIVGAQCTGKTTLTEAIAVRLRREHAEMRLEVINEMARSVLEKHHFSRDDVREGSERCMLLQKLILESQYERETSCDPGAILLSDRSGIDPIVYASVFAPDSGAAQRLIESLEWKGLRTRMMRAVVIVCEPVEDWLFDDGIRLMPESRNEWMYLHEACCRLLKDHNIPFEVLPPSLRSLPERVEFVLSFSRT